VREVSIGEQASAQVSENLMLAILVVVLRVLPDTGFEGLNLELANRAIEFVCVTKRAW
jgi:hypothetical protein